MAVATKAAPAAKTSEVRQLCLRCDPAWLGTVQKIADRLKLNVSDIIRLCGEAIHPARRTANDVQFAFEIPELCRPVFGKQTMPGGLGLIIQLAR